MKPSIIYHSKFPVDNVKSKSINALLRNMSGCIIDPKRITVVVVRMAAVSQQVLHDKPARNFPVATHSARELGWECVLGVAGWLSGWAHSGVCRDGLLHV